MKKRNFYNLVSALICQLIKIPFTQRFFLKVYDTAFKTYYNFEKYRQDDPWLFESDFQRKRIRAMVDFISDRHWHHCLDIGCADGYITSKFVPYCDRITGVDISDYAIEQAKKKFAHPKIQYFAESARTYEMGKYDLVILGDVLYCFSQNLPQAVFLEIIQKICHHVRKGGGILLTSYLPRSSKSSKFILGYSQNYLKIFKSLGFVPKRKKVIVGYKEGKIFKDQIVLLNNQ